MVWMEDNICIYRYGEILHTSAVLFGTIHVIQGIYTVSYTHLDVYKRQDIKDPKILFQSLFLKK